MKHEKIYNNILELIGNTPLVRLKKIEEIISSKAKILAKVEFFNPSASIKDRAAYAMIKTAYEEKIINKDTVIIEPTSGNTGIGLAMVCSVLGNKLILTMPESMSIERRNILKAYGAKLVLTEASKGMQGTMDKARELHNEIKNSFIPQQFSNKANPEIHYQTTANEIYNDTKGSVDIIMAGVGTGGTISGISKKLKELKPEIKAIALEPASSPLISKGEFGPHKIQGIGANFIPDNYNSTYIDEVMTVENDEALENMKLLAEKEGIFAGISAGAALSGAIKTAQKEENKDKTIVVILPDTGMRYLSTL